MSDLTPPPRTGPTPATTQSVIGSDAERRALRTLWWAIEQSPVALMITDRRGRIVYVNPHFSDITGYGRTEVLGRSPDFLKSDTAEATIDNEVRSALDRGERWRGTLRNRRADGSPWPVEVAIAPVKDAAGQTSHYVAVYSEANGDRQAEPQPAAGASPFRELVESGAHGVVIERDGVPLYANRAFAAVFGYAGADEIAALTSLDGLFPAEERGRVQRYRRARSGGIFAPKAFQCRALKKDGAIIWLDVRVRAVMWEGAAATYWTVTDITLRRIYEDRLHHQANFDPVTDLPNRSLALDRLFGAIVTGRRRFRKVGVLFIDIDGFKAINDGFGHAVGDRFLRQLGERIRMCVREEDTVARLGGDEFTVVLPDLRSSADAEGVARKIIETVSAPFGLEGREAFVGASIGITISPEDGDDAETLLRNADAAMYQAKTSGRNRLRFFTPELNALAVQRNRAEDRLRVALQRDELRVLYQPIVELETDAVIGAEALLRWHDPELGIVDAEHFIRMAEETGLIVPIGTRTVAAACDAAARWRRDGHAAFFVSVNVCTREFRGDALAEAVVKALHRNDLDADGLHLEFAESVLTIELPQILRSVRKLASAGVRLSLDDFGTGYSSLSALGKFPLTTVKIDGSLIRRVVSSPVQASLVEAIIAVARKLGFRVIAEGVETAQQLAFLRSRGCDAAQGYVFSEPLTVEGVADFLRTWVAPGAAVGDEA
jgi:diguanylate cyclase (GGDEF)-like protein/PAS domain S-box-containing protein